MSRRISVAAACVALIAPIALPAAAAAAANHVHTFSIPGVYGVRAWGSYNDMGAKIRITVCVKDTARSVYGAGAVGLAFTVGYQHHNAVSAVTVGYDHSRCHIMLTPYRGHLVVTAFSGYKNGKIRQDGMLKRIY